MKLKVKLVVKRPYGDVILEGDSFDELIENLKALPEWLGIMDGLIFKSETPTAKKEALKGLVEYTGDGPVVAAPREKLSDKEAICLVLYSSEPTLLQPKEVSSLLL